MQPTLVRDFYIIALLMLSSIENNGEFIYRFCKQEILPWETRNKKFWCELKVLVLIISRINELMRIFSQRRGLSKVNEFQRFSESQQTTFVGVDKLHNFDISFLFFILASIESSMKKGKKTHQNGSSFNKQVPMASFSSISSLLR